MPNQVPTYKNRTTLKRFDRKALVMSQVFRSPGNL